MNWWIVIAAFRLLNVDDWLLTMQRDLHPRLTGRSGQADRRGHEAEASSWPVFSLARALSTGGPDHTGAWGGRRGPQLPLSLLWVCAVSRYTAQARSQIRTRHLECALPLTLERSSHTPTYWDIIRHHKPATHCHVVTYHSSSTCIILLPPWGCPEQL